MTTNIFLEDLEHFTAEPGHVVSDPRPKATLGGLRAKSRHARPEGLPPISAPVKPAPLPAVVQPPTFEELRIADLREILTAPLDLDAVPSAVQRAASICMAGIMTIALPPLGAALIVLNSIHEPDLRLTASLTALGGLCIALRMSAMVGV